MIGDDPSTLIEKVRFVVYIKTEEHFVLQLNQKCFVDTKCIEEADEAEVEL
jgi:hypothetical protein